jgi:hypothetical protein
MKKLLLTALIAGLALSSLKAQTIITASDMPVVNDSLRSSFAIAATTGFNFSTTGANHTWDFTSLVAVAQQVDQYRTALSVNPIYALTISPTAYGYKVADTLPGASAIPGITINDIYSFYNKKNGPSRFVAEAFAAKISNIPTPANYSDEDEIYFFPLNYTDADSSTFRLSITIPILGSFSMTGKRKTMADGWGTIKTPHFPTGISALRVRSVIDEMDTLVITGVPIPIALTRKTVEYKWLANGEHFPVLWVTATEVAGIETVNSVQYRDHYRPLAVIDPSSVVRQLSVSPNPATKEISIETPANWKSYEVKLFDLTGKLVSSRQNTSKMNISNLPGGQYIITVTSAGETGVGRFIK